MSRERASRLAHVPLDGMHAVTAVLAVVVAALLSLAFSQLRLRHIDQQALDIVDDAAPSIDHVSDVRTELRHLGMYVNEYVAWLGDGRIISRDEVRATRRRLGEELATYESLPSFPGEHGLLADVVGALTSLDEVTAKALDEADAGSPTAAKRTLHEAFHPLVERTDEAVSKLKRLNAINAHTRGEAILHSRREAARLAGALGVATAVVAVIATLLVLRVLRGRARLIAEHQGLLAARATELEAFAGRVAHDLKNPLGAVALRIISAGRRHDLDPQVRDTLDRMGRQVERMDHIIDGLLEFARAGANPPPGAHADLGVILDEVISEVRPAAEVVRAELRVEPFPSTEFACTEGALTSVLSNLLGNAIKYIAEGGRDHRRISVRVHDLGNLARVEVADNGPRIPPGAEDKVFEPFRRFAEAKQPGIGLGLATVKRIVEAYGGRVGVRSRPGDGSTFWFEVSKAGTDVPPVPGPLGSLSGHDPPGPSHLREVDGPWQTCS